MEADAGFVQDIENADQPGADLRRQPDALRFAAAQRSAFAVQGQIAEPHIFEKSQAG